MILDFLPDQPDLSARKFRPEDTPNFVELGRDTCAFMYAREGTPVDTLQRNFTSFVKDFAFERDSQIYVVETISGDYVAQIWLHSTRNRFSQIPELWVWDLTVKAGFRRRGIASRLLQFAEQECVRQGAAELWLLVSSKNLEASALYAKHGLVPEGHLLAKRLPRPGTVTGPPKIQLAAAELRRLDAAKADDLYRLWDAAGLPFRPRGRDERRRLMSHLAGTEAGGFGLFKEGQLVAGVLLSADGRKGYVERLAVIPEERRAGFGKVLLLAAMEEFKRRGLLVFAALIHEDNFGSRRLFESCGWSRDPTVCYYSFREDPGY